jgi:hypothetical protein
MCTIQTPSRRENRLESFGYRGGCPRPAVWLTAQLPSYAEFKWEQMNLDRRHF